MQNMLAARYLGPSQIEPIIVSVPAIEPGEALIKVSACGFCGSDIGIISGTHPRAKEPLTIGHEFCGTVVEIGSSNQGFAVGDFVTLYPLISCGVCIACRTGHPHVCRTLRLYGFDTAGGMAEYVKVSISGLIKLPKEISPQVGALIEPLAVAVHGVSSIKLTGNSVIAVLGAGPIGLLTALVASHSGNPKVVISDVLPSRIELASHLGLRAVSAGNALSRAVDALTAGEGVDAVFECAGVPASAREMTSLLRPRGTIINLGVFKEPVPIDMQAVNFKELTIAGSRVYTKNDFATAVNLASHLPLNQIVTHTFPLHDVKSAFELFKQGEGVCKVVILPNATRE